MELNERLEKLHDAITSVADCALPWPLREDLDAARLAAGEPKSVANVEHFVGRPGKPDWRERMGRHVGHAFEGIAIANYHVERVAQIEAEIASMIASLDDPPPSTNVGFGSRKLNAEYQAFVFALRRSLEYFAAAVGAFFKTDCRRIKDVAGAIENREPLQRSAAAQSLIRTRLAEMQGLLTRDGSKSVRDRMAHEEFVFAGGFSATWDASGRLQVTGIIGGGEDPPVGADPSKTLSMVLRTQFDEVTGMIIDTYAVLGLLPHRSK